MLSVSTKKTMMKPLPVRSKFFTSVIVDKATLGFLDTASPPNPAPVSSDLANFFSTFKTTFFCPR